jgi:hypothetical protein
MIGFFVWGMSTSLAMALTVRALLGATNGNGKFTRSSRPALSPLSTSKYCLTDRVSGNHTHHGG